MKNKGAEYKYLGNFLKFGFRLAKKGKPFNCFYPGDSEEYRWMNAGYITFKMF